MVLLSSSSRIKQILFEFCLFIAIFIFVSGVIILEAAQSEIAFIGNRVKIFFHPPLRTGPLDQHPMSIEIPKLNLLVIQLENYLAYLTHLGKLPEFVNLILHYYPDGTDESIDGVDRLIIMDLGWNNLLQNVNKYLLKRSDFVQRYLIDNAESLFQIRDQLSWPNNTFEDRSGFKNLSEQLKALNPESDFALIGTSAAVTIRPTETTNQIVYLPFTGTGSILLPSGKDHYAKLRPSPNGEYLAFTEGGIPNIIDLHSKTVTNLYANGGSKMLLGANWSPDGRYFAGIVLDKETSEREVFLFDVTKKEHKNFFQGNPSFQGDYQYAYPFWAPDSRKVIFSDGHNLTLLDIQNERLIPDLIKTNKNITEIVWSHDSRSFATVEMEGKARDMSEFDSRDLRGWVLRRWNLTPTGQAIEDPRQTYASKEPLKLVSFWTLDRILFLEGHIRTPRIQTCVMDLTGKMSARLTPTPTLSHDASKSRSVTGFVDLPIKYCYVIKNLDSRFKNVYDIGYGHTNQLFLDEQICVWLLGLRLPEGLPIREETFNMMPSPYPFQERNITYCHDLPLNQIKKMIEIIKRYNLRRFELSSDLTQMFFLSNTRGPLTLWAADVTAFDEIDTSLVSKNEPNTPAREQSETTAAEKEEPLPGDALPLPGDELPLPKLPAKSNGSSHTSESEKPTHLPSPVELPKDALPLPSNNSEAESRKR